ncbi:MAG: hypothetical protein IJE29_05300 [Firmicutes bacterium]|nr:hypothetical protein [Bacillota bacterium]
MIDIEKLELGAELTADLDFWLNEPAADETGLADWLAVLVSGEDENAEFEKSADLLRVLSSAAAWDESTAEVIKADNAYVDDAVDGNEGKLSVANWPEIAPEDGAPGMTVNLDGDSGETLWEPGGVLNDAPDAADAAASDGQALAVTEAAGAAADILAGFGAGRVAADEAEDGRNVGALAGGWWADGEAMITAVGEAPGRIEDEPGAASWGENGPEMWPLIDLPAAATGDMERRAVDGDVERKTVLAEAWHNNDAAEGRRDLIGLAARLAGPVADLVAARLNAELQIMLHSR